MNMNFSVISGLIHLLPRFHGFADEDPHNHLKEFHSVCFSIGLQGVSKEYVKLKAFPFSLQGIAKDWLYHLPPCSITSWHDLKKKFLVQFYPAFNEYNLCWRNHPNFGWGIDSSSPSFSNTKYHPPPLRQQQQNMQQDVPSTFSEPSLNDLVKQMATNSLQFQQNVYSTIQDLQTQIGQLVTTVNHLQSQGSTQLPTQPVINPTNVSAISVRSGKQVQTDPTILRHLNQKVLCQTKVSAAQVSVQVSDAQVSALVEEPGLEVSDPVEVSAPYVSDPSVKYDPQVPNSKVSIVGSAPDEESDQVSTPQVSDPKISTPQVSDAEVSIPQVSARQLSALHQKVPLPFPNRMTQQRPIAELDNELLDTFRKVEVNIPLLDAIKQIPRYAKSLKEPCTPKMPEKCKDPGTFIVSCTIGNCRFDHALIDLGVAINVMPHSVYASLKEVDMDVIDGAFVDHREVMEHDPKHQLTIVQPMKELPPPKPPPDFKHSVFIIFNHCALMMSTFLGVYVGLRQAFTQFTVPQDYELPSSSRNPLDPD